MRARKAWVKVDWHPPLSDLRKSFQFFVTSLTRRSLFGVVGLLRGARFWGESVDILGDRFIEIRHDLINFSFKIRIVSVK